jgi:hypothetical protein
VEISNQRLRRNDKPKQLGGLNRANRKVKNLKKEKFYPSGQNAVFKEIP